MYRFIIAATLFLGLTACTNDVIIHTKSGAVNIGEVTAEVSRTKVIGSVEGNEFDLGIYPTSDFATALKEGWTGVDDTAMLQRDMQLDLQTMITYKGTKNTVDRLIDTTVITCPKGFMFGTCLSRVEATQEGLMLLYKEKFSYLK